MRKTYMILGYFRKKVEFDGAISVHENSKNQTLNFVRFCQFSKVGTRNDSLPFNLVDNTNSDH